MLIPPATRARYLANRYLPILDSYVQAPQAHEQAVQIPNLRGGPFIDLPQRNVDGIRKLMQDTSRARRDFLDLSRALDKLHDMLSTHPSGYSLESVYSRIPTELKGKVELTYNLFDSPNYRLIEPALYRSLDHSSGQSVTFSTIVSDDRPFVMSTPRLDGSETIDLDRPFADRAYDEIFRSEYCGKPWRTICDLFNVDDEQSYNMVRSLFADNGPERYDRFCGNGFRWRYFGHACVLLESATASLLVDPMLSYSYDAKVSRYTYRDLPEHIDAVLITHNHQDHISIETLLKLRHRIGTIIVPRGGSGQLQDPSLYRILRQCGFDSVQELAELEVLTVGDVEIVGLPFLGEHGDLDISTKLAYLVNHDNRRFVFAADACNLDPEVYTQIAKWYGSVDVLFVGMECDGAPMSWVYGPLRTGRIPSEQDRTRRLAGSNYSQVLRMIEAMGVAQVYVYAMGQEPWLYHIMSVKYTENSRPIVESSKILSTCRERGISAERLFGEKEMFV